MLNLYAFIAESNRIEGIHRPPSEIEIRATKAFIEAPQLSIVRLKELVGVYQPNARLRDKVGLDVRVGNYYPPPGGPNIKLALRATLDRVNARVTPPYQLHHEYESLHPFTDGNGRSGRAIWLWSMRGDAPLGFLHTWYYQSLQEAR